MLLNDKDIRDLCVDHYVASREALGIDFVPMISPFSEAVSGGGTISFGLTSAGYDLRLGQHVKVFSNAYGEAVDPKKFGDREYQRRMFIDLMGLSTGQEIIIPAHQYILAYSHEYLRIPRHLKARCVGKSTLARCGIIVNTTPLEPGWEGHLTIEISNSCPCPAKVYVGEGIAQLEFEMLTGPPLVDYAQKKGKYQGQTGVTPAVVQ